MIVKIARPPLFAEIDAAFRVGTQRIYYAWGETIFDPFGDGRICRELLMHESVHRDRQGARIEEWWRRYINDPAFRLVEEIPAHQAEYREFAATTPTAKSATTAASIYTSWRRGCRPRSMVGSCRTITRRR
jgi:hypothetical protein